MTSLGARGSGRLDTGLFGLVPWVRFRGLGEDLGDLLPPRRESRIRAS